MNLISNCLYEVADLIYPPKCLVCGDFKGSDICDKCYDMIADSSDDEIHIDNIEKVFIIGKYDGVLEKAIRLLKFHGKLSVSKVLAKLLINNINRVYIKYNDTIFIPIPLHKKRLRQRSYNQCRKILEEAKKIIPEINIIEENIFIRIKNTPHFFDLDRIKRNETIQNTFKVADENYFKGKNIILFDDILTTGATLRESAKTLKIAGAEEIRAVVLAKA